LSDAERRRAIVDYLRDRPFASVRDLQDHLGVSAATVRRDIDKVDGLGIARKVYGGVSALQPAAVAAFALPYDENRDLAVDAKGRIAEAAATMVHDGDSIIINGGSTCFQLGVRLVDKSMRLFTNSMPLATYMSEHGRCSLTVAGGDLHREPRILYSPDASPFYASKFFLGAQGISAEGVLESHPLLVRSIQELSQRVDQIIILADSRKFGIRARNVSLPLSRIDTVITDEGLSDTDARLLESEGVKVKIAETPRA
jgi:DeoR family transcriptional regulator, ulaG and ulaABCDEF operon transcriptional repressor